MPYDEQKSYAKFLKGKCHEGHGDHEKGCGCEKCKTEDCGCCPPGLVAVRDDDQNFVGCLTPNDAELYQKNSFKCDDGYIKVYDGDGNFIGCLTPDEYKIYIDSQP